MYMGNAITMLSKSADEPGAFSRAWRRMTESRELSEEEEQILKEELGEHYEDLRDNIFIPSRAHPGHILANTVGHVGTVLQAPILQERTLQALRSPDLREKARVIRRFAERFPEETRGLEIQLGAARPIRNTRRALDNTEAGTLERIMATLRAGATSHVTNLSRGHHYMPGADSLTVYGNQPELLAHEMGHGVDFRRKNPEQRDGYIIGRGLTDSLIPGTPFTLFMEGIANRRAGQTMEGEDEEKTRARRRFRRMAFPAYSTYATGSLLGLAAAHRFATQEDNAIMRAFEGFRDRVHASNIPKPLRPLAISMGAILPGALAARGIAEGVNLADTLKSRRERLRKEREEGDSDD